MKTEGEYDTPNQDPDSWIQKAARAAHAEIPDMGFILIVVPFGDGSGATEAQCISNVKREDAVAGLKQLLFRWGIEGEWIHKAE